MFELYGKQNCGFCVQAVTLLETYGVGYQKFVIDENITREEFVEKFPDVRSVPLFCKDGERIGGYHDLKEYLV